jgi:hypothetical protein
MKRYPGRSAQAHRRQATSEPTPIVELSEAGLYVRFAPRGACARTVANGRWPHLAVDFDRQGRVIGVEAMPLPDRFSLSRLARRAGLRLSPAALRRARLRLKFSAADNF